MIDEFIYVIIVMSIVFVLGAALSYVIMKTNFLYDEETARWKSGINLPGLDAKTGDKVQHQKFKNFIGLNTLFIIVTITVVTVLGLYFMPDSFSNIEEIRWTRMFVTVLFALLLPPIVLMFSNFKERYIERVNSSAPKHHKVILMVITGLLIVIALLTWFLA